MSSASSQNKLKVFVALIIIVAYMSQTLTVVGEENLNIAEQSVSKNVSEQFVMPTIDKIELNDTSLKNRVAGTDRWNDLIFKVSLEENIDPIFVKCIMALESGGNEGIVNYNANNTSDYGLMQVNNGWGTSFDYQKMLNEPEYAIRSGIIVIKRKIEAAQKAGHVPTVYEVAWRYNGYSQRGQKYANRFQTLYENVSNGTSDKSIVLENNELASNDLA